MDSFPQPDEVTIAKRAALAKWLTAIAYFGVTFISAWWLSGYLARVGDTQNIPNAMWLFFGPVIALAMVHGIAIYIVASAVVLPLLLASVGSSTVWRSIYLCGAASVWVAIGYWMYGG